MQSVGSVTSGVTWAVTCHLRLACTRAGAGGAGGVEEAPCRMAHMPLANHSLSAVISYLWRRAFSKVLSIVILFPFPFSLSAVNFISGGTHSQKYLNNVEYF